MRSPYARLSSNRSDGTRVGVHDDQPQLSDVRLLGAWCAVLLVLACLAAKHAGQPATQFGLAMFACGVGLRVCGAAVRMSERRKFLQAPLLPTFRRAGRLAASPLLMAAPRRGTHHVVGSAVSPPAGVRAASPVRALTEAMSLDGRRVGDADLFGKKDRPSGAPQQASPLALLPANAGWMAAVALCAVAWAGNFPIIKLLVGDDMMPGSFASLRFGAAAICLLPWLPRGTAQSLKGGLEVGLWLAVGYIGQAVGLQTRGAAEACFICSLQVVLVTLWTAAQRGRLRPNDGVAAALAVGGVALLEGVASGNGLSVGPDTLALLLQPLAFGITYVRIEEIMEEAPNDALSVAAAQMASLFVCCLGYAYFMEGGLGTESGLVTAAAHLADWSGPTGIGIAYTAVLGTALSVAVEVEALRHVSSGEAACILTTEPLFAALWASLLLGEQMSVEQAAGGLLILAACAVKLQMGDGAAGDGNGDADEVEAGVTAAAPIRTLP